MARGMRTLRTAHGRLVSFTTGVALAPGDTNDADDVVVFDRENGTFKLASRTRSGMPSRYGSFTGYTPRALSSTGDMIVFTTGSDDIAPDDRNERADIIAMKLIPTRTSAWRRAVNESIKPYGPRPPN